MLVVTELNVGYGEIQVLWDISFNVNRGEVVAILGPNGAGKTTTLKTIAGLLKPIRGSIIFQGSHIEGLPPYKIVDMGIALVPEGRRLFPYMTVYENLELGAYTKRATEKFHDTLEWIYSLFPILKERKDQLAGTLSGGEQQMLAIARALMSRPTLLMMDEPSLGLAPKVVADVFKTIKNLNEEGVTILLVEQNVKKALEVSHRAYVIEGGRIVLSGGSDKLMADERVKRTYLGIY